MDSVIIDDANDNIDDNDDDVVDDSFDLGSDEESEGQGGRSKITYKMTLSTENLTEHRRSMAQTQI